MTMANEYDLIITGGQVVTGEGTFPATVAVNGGRIVGILAPEESPPAGERVVADGLHVLPGIIDTHVHLRDPGHTEREDFFTGTSAAAAGGITTILEMPLSDPPVNSGEILARRAEQVQPKALVDYALYGGVNHETMGQVQAMTEAGAVAFKTFRHASVPGREDEFEGLCCTEDGPLWEVASEVARTGLLHCIHCESNNMLELLKEKLLHEERTDGIAHAESRPPTVEDVSVATLLAIAADVGGRVQVVHMSSPLSAQLVREAKVRGIPVTAETCPQYLFLTEDALQEYGPYAKCNPALRNSRVVEDFWKYLKNGTIDVVGSDHAPFLESEKDEGLDNIFSAPAGLPGLEIMLPLMLNAVSKGQLSLPAVVRLMSERAAELFRLPGKGRITPGADADLVLVDMESDWEFDRSRSFSKAGSIMKVYDGMKLRGRVSSTFVRGERVCQEGEITGSPGHGTFLRPIPKEV